MRLGAHTTGDEARSAASRTLGDVRRRDLLLGCGANGRGGKVRRGSLEIPSKQVAEVAAAFLTHPLREKRPQRSCSVCALARLRTRRRDTNTQSPQSDWRALLLLLRPPLRFLHIAPGTPPQFVKICVRAMSARRSASACPSVARLSGSPIAPETWLESARFDLRRRSTWNDCRVIDE